MRVTLWHLRYWQMMHFCLQEVLSMDENVALWQQVLKSQMPWYL